MRQLTMADLSKAIAAIDVAMLSSRAVNGYIAARPMINNCEVAYEGDSYFFAYESSHTVLDIARDSRVGLSFSGVKGRKDRRIYVAIEADAEVVRDRTQFPAQWNKRLDAWADQGMETPGLVMIKASAVRIHYWRGNEEYDVALGTTAFRHEDRSAASLRS